MSREDPTFDVARVHNTDGAAPVLILCEHASCDIPDRFGGLGISPDVQRSHAGWDPGALDHAQRLSRALNAPLVAGAVSRLVYDCNRPPDAPDACTPQSEVHPIPGNQGLSAAARAERAALIYAPFCATVDAVIADTAPRALITIHSFTPVYNGVQRPVQIGIVHDSDARLADPLLIALADAPFRVARNDPYGPEHGVTHSLRKHALSRGMLNVMIEIRNDLLETPADRLRIAHLMTAALRRALDACGLPLTEETQ